MSSGIGNTNRKAIASILNREVTPPTTTTKLRARSPSVENITNVLNEIHEALVLYVHLIKDANYYGRLSSTNFIQISKAYGRKYVSAARDSSPTQARIFNKCVQKGTLTVVLEPMSLIYYQYNSIQSPH